jgi:glycosyltransferase involved in cell wall biosynthesis
VRVLIDTTIARRAPLSGTAVYLERITEALGARHDVEVVTAENPERPPPAGGGAGSLRNLLEDLRWTNVELPRRARKLAADVIHHPLPARAYPAGSLPQVITVHDLAFERRPHDFDPRFRLYAHLAHRSAARKANAVIAVSEATAHDAGELWGVPAERIVVARHGPGQPLKAAGSRGSGGGARYLLYVGDDEPRKDLPTLLGAYARYRAASQGGRSPLDLVLAGSVQAPDAPGVRTERSPDAARLAELYAGAVALVHPSRYEGFGMTVLEAMSLGVPVVAARCAAVREVCGDAGLLVWPGNPGELADALSRVASEPGLRARLSARGRERASAFSWARSAERHIAAYSLAVGS